MTRTAVVTGATGQDGWYLAQALLAGGWAVHGLVQQADPAALPPGVRPVTGDLRDEVSLRAALAGTGADVVYNLAAVSSVAASWADPVGTGDVNGLGVARLLRALGEVAAADGREIRLVQAGSAEIFGRHDRPSDETTPLAPINPYGAAKAYAHHLVRGYRAGGVHASNAVLFNHESPRRPAQFVTRKITSTVARIAGGSGERLELGDLDVVRDWGFAGDHMDALVRIAAHDEPGDWVVATGAGHTVHDFVAAAFRHAGVDEWAHLVSSSDEYRRPTDVPYQVGSPARAAAELGWTPTVGFDELVGTMVDADLAPPGSR